MMHGSVRMARNVAEKQRRDRLNSFINDLANSVPLVASATRRLDKTSILRLSAAFLRLHDSPLNVITYRQTAKDIVDSAGIENTSHSSTPVPLPLSPVTSNCLAGDQLNSLMEGLDGFVIVVNNDFKLMYVGPTCERFLGHQNIDMLGHQLSNFLHPADVEPVRQAVLDLKNQFLSSGQLESERIQFRCRMKERAQPRTEVVTYQIVKISGFFQLACPDNNSSTGNNNNSSSSSSNGSSQLAESLDHEAADVATLNQDDDASHGEISSPSRLAFTPVTAAATVTATAATSASNGTDTVASSSSSSSIVILSNGSEFEINHSSYPSSVTQDSDLIELDFQLSDFSPDSRSSFYPDFINECPPSSDHHHHHHQDHHHRQRHTLPPPPPLIPSTQLSQPSRHLMPVNGNCDRSSISLNNNSNNNHFNFLTPILSTTSSHASSTLSSPSSKRRLKQQQHHQHHRTPQPSNKQSLSSRFSGKFLSKNLMFKGFVEIVPASPMSELSLMDANQEEYVSRISLDGTLLYADHRISLVLGYTPSEVIGKSAYKYILVPDHVISLFAHKLMLSSSNGTGVVVHRLKTRSGGYIYLQSAGCLQYDRYTGKVDHFVNVARMLPEAEGQQEMQKFIRKFAPHVSSDSPSSLYRSLQMAIAPKTMSSIPPLPTQQEQEQYQLQQDQLQQQLMLQHQNQTHNHHLHQSSNIQLL